MDKKLKTLKEYFSEGWEVLIALTNNCKAGINLHRPHLGEVFSVSFPFDISLLQGNFTACILYFLAEAEKQFEEKIVEFEERKKNEPLPQTTLMVGSYPRE